MEEPRSSSKKTTREGLSKSKKMIDGDKERFWFREKDQQSHHELRGESDDPIKDEGGMREDTPEERRSDLLDALTQKVDSPEKENGELKKALQEMEAKMALQAKAIMATAERCSMLEKVFLEIIQHVRQHEAFNRSVKSWIDSLEK